MSLTPLSPMPAPPQVQAAPVPVQQAPQPMQPAAPWVPQVQAGFQQAYKALDPVVQHITAAEPQHKQPMAYGTQIAVVNPQPEYIPADSGYIKHGSVFSPYNGGYDDGPQTGAPAPADWQVSTGQPPTAGYPLPVGNGIGPQGGWVEEGPKGGVWQAPIVDTSVHGEITGPSGFTNTGKDPNYNPNVAPNTVKLPSDYYGGYSD